jgi:uncharacterized metal-binding protein YceD (DUF177 family)
VPDKNMNSLFNYDEKILSLQSFLQNQVKEQNRYNIDIYGLDDKPYEFDYEIGHSFFEELEQDLIERGEFEVHLLLDKSTTMLQLCFSIKGNVELICDRSLEPYTEEVDTEGVMILKFGDHDEELTEEISIINRNTTRINVAGYIFELIALALPMKKIHPDLRTESEKEYDYLVYSSEAVGNDKTEEQEEKIDPRWEALKKLKK